MIDVKIFADAQTVKTQIEGFRGLPGKDGRDGRDGADGLPGRDGRDGKDGAPGADGQPGKDGKDGADGYTPQRGTDYWTEADKKEIVDEVLSAMPDGGAPSKTETWEFTLDDGSVITKEVVLV